MRRPNALFHYARVLALVEMLVSLPRGPRGRSLLSCIGQSLVLFVLLYNNKWHYFRHFNAIGWGIFPRDISDSTNALMPHLYYNNPTHFQGYLLQVLTFITFIASTFKFWV